MDMPQMRTHCLSAGLAALLCFGTLGGLAGCTTTPAMPAASCATSDRLRTTDTEVVVTCVAGHTVARTRIPCMVQEVYATDGAHVVKGQALVRLTSAPAQRLRDKAAALEIEYLCAIARLQALVNGTAPQYPAAVQAYPDAIALESQQYAADKRALDKAHRRSPAEAATLRDTYTAQCRAYTEELADVRTKAARTAADSVVVNAPASGVLLLPVTPREHMDADSVLFSIMP